MSVSIATTSSSPTSHIRPLNILHTSDWHLGRRLYGRLRYDEFDAFLTWLYDTIITQHIEVLIVAGDIFDTMTPSNKAQALYYEFLGKVSKTCCQNIVIVAGNHDSPSFLDAPSQVLKFLNVHVIGTACDNLNDEVLILNDSSGSPHCIIAAVPYLRDRDVRGSGAGESAQDKDSSVIAGIRAHYDEVACIAKAKQQELVEAHQCHIPIIATGHLFAAGGATTDDDGVRDLYVGNLGKVSADMFDDCFDYVALGHLHVPQRVGGREHIRYSGSPIAMGFGEARQQKQVLLIQFGAVLHDLDDERLASDAADNVSVIPANITAPIKKLASSSISSSDFMDDLFGFDEWVENESNENDAKAVIQPSTNADHQSDHQNAPHALDLESTDLIISKRLHRDEASHMQIVSLPIPCFQKLAQISGDMQTIAAAIESIARFEPIWLEVVYTGDDVVSELREHIQEMVDGLPCEVLKIKNTYIYNKVLNQKQTSETLQDLNEQEVFERCLTAHDVPDKQKQSLRYAYEQILHNIHHADTQAE